MSYRSIFFERVPTATGFSANDKTWVARPIFPKGTPPAPPLIFAHGAGYNLDGSASAAGVLTAQYHLELVSALARYFTVFTSDFDVLQTKGIWGCVDHQNLIEDARTYLNSAYGTSGKVTLAGVSMGGLGVLNYAKNYSSNVRAIAPITAVIDLQVWWTYLDATGRSSIDLVYPGGYTDATYGASFNPAIWASGLDATIPVKLFYSTDDLPPFYTPIPAWLAARPATYAKDYPGGHAEAGLPAMNADIIKFLRYPSSVA